MDWAWDHEVEVKFLYHLALELYQVLLIHVLFLRVREKVDHFGEAWTNGLLYFGGHKDGDNSESANFVPVIGLPVNGQEESV